LELEPELELEDARSSMLDDAHDKGGEEQTAKRKGTSERASWSWREVGYSQ